MSKFMYNGKPYGGSTNYASSVTCTDAEGNESTVQAEIDKTFPKNNIYAELTDVVSSGNLCYTKTAEGILLLNGSFSVKANTTAGTTITTLPEGYRPRISTWLIGMCVIGTNKEPIQILLETNGTIKVYPSTVTSIYSVFIDSAILI